MNVLWQDLRHHLQTDFRLDLYTSTALWAALLLAVNYYFDLEDAYIDSFQGKPIWSVLYFGLYATTYYGSVWLWTHFHHRPDIWRNREFWLRSGCALICYSIYAGFYAHDWSRQLFGEQIYVYNWAVRTLIRSDYELPAGRKHLACRTYSLEFINKNTSVHLFLIATSAYCLRLVGCLSVILEM